MKPTRSYVVKAYRAKNGGCPFNDWFATLDTTNQARVDAGIHRLSQGNLANCKWVGGVFELKLNFGPGYRVYFAYQGKQIVLLLCGGDKGRQSRDIKKAIELLKEAEGKK